jgi:peptidoglycan hydrolase-like protein with peptidoglycan-binding domain
MGVCGVGSRLLLFTIHDATLLSDESAYDEIPSTYGVRLRSDQAVSVKVLAAKTPEELEVVWGNTYDAKTVFSRSLRLLKDHLHGLDVFCLQRFLALEEFKEVGDVDGWFGEKTRQAVIEFQRIHQLEPTGIVDKQTWAIIDEDYSRRRGD